ncbi:MAG: class I SAM-dependent RNA methyltransferase [Alphaproteobacteria bacterium]|nr:class I SAM-dependent RNA methyltransferase [Alphaproteobacteria bacterium]
MTTEIFIEKQGFMGDGIGYINGQKTIVPFAAKGDTLKVRIIKQNSKLIQAEIVEVVSPSPMRAVPPCKYFGICGGCEMQHLNQDLYIQTKLEVVRNAINRAGGLIENIEFIDVSPKSRRKAKFHTKNGKIGFYKRNSKDIVEINSCEVLSDKIIEKLKSIRKNGASTEVIELVEENTIDIAGFKVPYNGFFLQASRDTNEIIANLILPTLNNDDKISDLFSGVAAYSLYLYKHALKFDAFDGDDKIDNVISSLKVNHQIDNIRFFTRDLFKSPLSHKELPKYDSIIINPPKNGAEPQFIEIAKSKVKNVHIVSCSPISLERDLQHLVQAGYKIQKAALIDQFKWSSHSEVYLHLIR